MCCRLCRHPVRISTSLKERSVTKARKPKSGLAGSIHSGLIRYPLGKVRLICRGGVICNPCYVISNACLEYCHADMSSPYVKCKMNDIVP